MKKQMTTFSLLLTTGLGMMACATMPDNSTNNPSPASTGSPGDTQPGVPTEGQISFNGFESVPTEEHSGVTLTADRFGVANSAYRFSGEGSFLKLPININPGVYPALTVSVWARFLPSSNPDGGVYQVVSHDNGGFDRSIGIDDRSSGGFGWSSFAGSAEVLGARPAITGAWVQLTTVYDQAASSARFFVNGQMVASSNSATLNEGEEFLLLGSNPAFVEHFPGDIDDLRIYSRALSGDEVKTLYDRSKP